MDILFPLIENIIPLYLLIALGFVAGRYLDVHLHSIARINIFILIPIVAFGAITRMEFDLSYFILPVMLSVASIIITFIVYRAAGKVWSDGRANLLGSGSVNGNAIYFGLPLVIFLFGPEWAGVYLFMNMGPQINNITMAYFLAARGRFSLRESFKRVLKFPAIHATWVAILLNLSGWSPNSDVFTTYWQYAAGTMTFLGMMMIGVGLSKLEKLEVDWGFVLGLFVSKFMLWPLMTLGLIYIDMSLTQLFEPQIYQMLVLWSAMPLMGNLVAYAAEYDLYPAKAAAAVLLSSIFALVSIPCAYFFGQLFF